MFNQKEFLLGLSSRVLMAPDIKPWISSVHNSNKKQNISISVHFKGCQANFGFASFLIMEKRRTNSSAPVQGPATGAGWRPLVWLDTSLCVTCSRLSYFHLLLSSHYWSRTSVKACVCAPCQSFLWFSLLRLRSENRFGFSPRVTRTFFFSL